MTAREFMFGYESPITTLGNKFMPDWIYFEQVGLIDRVRILQNSGKIKEFIFI